MNRIYYFLSSFLTIVLLIAVVNHSCQHEPGDLSSYDTIYFQIVSSGRLNYGSAMDLQIINSYMS